MIRRGQFYGAYHCGKFGPAIFSAIQNRWSTQNFAPQNCFAVYPIPCYAHPMLFPLSCYFPSLAYPTHQIPYPSSAKSHSILFPIQSSIPPLPIHVKSHPNFAPCLVSLWLQLRLEIWTLIVSIIPIWCKYDVHAFLSSNQHPESKHRYQFGS